MFAAWFRQRLADRGLSYAAFGRLVFAAKPSVGAIAAGRRGPPLDRLPAWLAALGIDHPDEVDQVTLMAAVAHLPQPIALRILAMDTELRGLRDQMAAIQRMLPAGRRSAPQPLRGPGQSRPGGGRGRR